MTKQPTFTRINGEDVATVAGIIAITRVIAASDPANKRAASFLAWVDHLGRIPTDAEFAEWTKRHGIQMRRVKGE